MLSVGIVDTDVIGVAIHDSITNCRHRYGRRSVCEVGWLRSLFLLPLRIREGPYERLAGTRRGQSKMLIITVKTGADEAHVVITSHAYAG